MPAPQILLQAALQRLSMRLGSSLVDAAAQLSLLAQDAPDKFRQELLLFWEEVELEADRLERGDDAVVSSQATAEPVVAPAPGDPQSQIDALRAQVAAMVRGLDQRSQASRPSQPS